MTIDAYHQIQLQHLHTDPTSFSSLLPPSLYNFQGYSPSSASSSTTSTLLDQFKDDDNDDDEEGSKTGSSVLPQCFSDILSNLRESPKVGHFYKPD